LLKNNISNELESVNKKFHEQFPGSAKKFPTLKELCDVFMFYYQESINKYINNEDLVSQNVVMIINNRMNKIMYSADALYNLSESKFMAVVTKYVKNKKLAYYQLNSVDIIQKRSKIIENLNLAKKKLEENKDS
jgi:hypothetical protein